MSISDEIKNMIKNFVGQKEDSKKKIDDHLEKIYQKKENSLTKQIKNKTRLFKEILLKNGFEEAEHYKENRLWKWKYYKEVSPYVAFIVNLEPYDNYMEIYYGYASTAFTKMTGCANALKEHGVSSDGINVRSMTKYIYGDDEKTIGLKIKEFYDKYVNLSKDEILDVAKEKKKEFINKINQKLKLIGMKKKSNTWTIKLNEDYFLSFILDKTRFCDCYRFNYEIDNIENQVSYRKCHTKTLAYEYKSESYDYNWQCYTEEEFNDFFDFIINDNLLPIIKVDISKLKDLINELNEVKGPKLFISTDENIRFYNEFTCDVDNCSKCYKKTPLLK